MAVAGESAEVLGCVFRWEKQQVERTGRSADAEMGGTLLPLGSGGGERI